MIDNNLQQITLTWLNELFIDNNLQQITLTWLNELFIDNNLQQITRLKLLIDNNLQQKLLKFYEFYTKTTIF